MVREKGLIPMFKLIIKYKKLQNLHLILQKKEITNLIADEIKFMQDTDEDSFNQGIDLITDRFMNLGSASELSQGISKIPFGSISECREGVHKATSEIVKLGRLPVVTFSAGGIATPADAALMMNMGMDGIFVGSGIFKSENPTQTAEAIVYATHHFDDPAKITEACSMVGEAMPGLEIETLDVKLENRGW